LAGNLHGNKKRVKIKKRKSEKKMKEEKKKKKASSNGTKIDAPVKQLP